MTKCTALRGKLEAAISLEMRFPKYGNRKKAIQQSMSKDQIDCALQTGPITWTLGAKGVVLLLRLWLWISKIKQQKKKRKCNKTKIHKNSQYTLNTTTDVCLIYIHSYFTFHLHLYNSAFLCFT